MERTEPTFTFDTERMREQIRFEPVKDSAYQLFQTTRKDETIRCKVNSIKCSREIKKTDMIFLRAYGIAEVVMDIQNSRLSRVVLTVFRLVRI